MPTSSLVKQTEINIGAHSQAAIPTSANLSNATSTIVAATMKITGENDHFIGIEHCQTSSIAELSRANQDIKQ